jgi:predicted transcriptional regulator
LVEDYFEGSVENVLSFMVKEKGLSEKDMEELQKLIDNMGNSSKP